MFNLLTNGGKMARPIWSGAISFGLINIPIKLYVAIHPKDIRFHQLHSKDAGRIQYKKFCANENIEVPQDEIVKGFEVSSGSYITIDPEELSQLDPKASSSIQIEDFVYLDQVDPIFFDSTYYVLPAQNAEKAYRLLSLSMQETKRVAIAKMVMRTKEYLCTLRPLQDALVLETMNFSDEIVDIEAIFDESKQNLREPDVTPKEIAMAQQLIDSLTTEFDASKYHDEYRLKVKELIDAKTQGKQIQKVKQQEPEPIGDLIAALEASIASSKANSKINKKAS